MVRLSASALRRLGCLACSKSLWAAPRDVVGLVRADGQCVKYATALHQYAATRHLLREHTLREEKRVHSKFVRTICVRSSDRSTQSQQVKGKTQYKKRAWVYTWVYTQQTKTIEFDELKVGRSDRYCPRPRRWYPLATLFGVALLVRFGFVW
jgi:hypothetical protein